MVARNVNAPTALSAPLEGGEGRGVLRDLAPALRVDLPPIILMYIDEIARHHQTSREQQS